MTYKVTIVYIIFLQVWLALSLGHHFSYNISTKVAKSFKDLKYFDQVTFWSLLHLPTCNAAFDYSLAHFYTQDVFVLN